MSRDAYLAGACVLGASRALAFEEDDEAPTDEDIAEAAVAAVEQHLTSVPNTDGGRTVDGGGRPGVYEAPQQSSQQPRLLQSAIEGVPSEAWTRFVLAMRTASSGAVSASNALGLFEMRPRRLADLGLIENLTKTRAPGGRLIWTGDWVKPINQRAFLDSTTLQYKAFCASMLRYIDGLRDGTIEQPENGVDDDMSLSGALAILHRCGPSGLKTWGNEEARFNDTVELYNRSNGIF